MDQYLIEIITDVPRGDSTLSYIFKVDVEELDLVKELYLAGKQENKKYHKNLPITSSTRGSIFIDFKRVVSLAYEKVSTST